MKFFKPDFQIHHFTDITKEWLEENQVKTILSDLDSTLAIHDQPGDTDVKNWIHMLKENNVKLIIVSNNSQERVDQFCEVFSIVGFGRCGKPAAFRIKQHMENLHAKTETSLFLGDQLLTDIWCGKRLDIRTSLVTPIGREHEPIQIVLKRKIETWMINKW